MCPPDALKSGLHVPIVWMWMPWKPGSSPSSMTVTRKPRVGDCSMTTVPMASPSTFCIGAVRRASPPLLSDPTETERLHAAAASASASTSAAIPALAGEKRSLIIIAYPL